MPRLLTLLCATAFVATPAVARSQVSDPVRIRAAVDSIAAAALATGRAAGLSIGVVRGRDTIVLKGYGKADLELDVPTPDRAVYEIGSVTKQFTSASILLLMEQGKLSLDDPMTKYLPDYPMQGHVVTIRRLLDHTSGIMGYTEMPMFGGLMMQHLSRDTLVKLISAQPFKFAPGEGLSYNNSGYFLLGLIIEKASGMPYAEFVQKNLFDRVGMRDSHYCSEREIMPRKVKGYEVNGNRLVLKGYLDHTWPYAAGSLCSSAWDLVAWTQALHGGRVLKPESYRLITTPQPLNDGTPVRYAMGLSNDSLGGHHVIQHGGGINGFLTDLAYFPDDQLTIAVLVNTAGPVAPGGNHAGDRERDPWTGAAGAKPAPRPPCDGLRGYVSGHRPGRLAHDRGHGRQRRRAPADRRADGAAGGPLHRRRQLHGWPKPLQCRSFRGRVTGLRADLGSVVSNLTRRN